MSKYIPKSKVKAEIGKQHIRNRYEKKVYFFILLNKEVTEYEYQELKKRGFGDNHFQKLEKK